MITSKSLPAPADFYPVRRALLSVYDKTGIVELAKALHNRGVELISTGGTSKALLAAGLPVTSVSSLTGYPEILGGRVKTLHPLIHGGLLARKTDPEDLEQLAQHGGAPIDLVVVNLYPFSIATKNPETDDATAVENIDIGGPTMIRAAAKNFFFTAVLTSPSDYGRVMQELATHDGALSMSTRRAMAHEAFRHTASYDSAIDDFFARASTAETTASPLNLNVPHALALRYGENPHQTAALYGDVSRFIEKVHGKELSFNNLLDLSAALSLMDEFRDADPTCAILKHTNPCGVAVADSLKTAYDRAFSTDTQSPFGGIVIVNRPLDMDTAKAIDAIFTELIIAPAYETGVLDFLMQKKNRRLIVQKLDARQDDAKDIRSVVGGLLVQDRDAVLPNSESMKERCRVVTSRAPGDDEWADLDFAWRIAKHVKSNAIVYAKNRQTIGIGAGQMSRIDASEVAVRKGQKANLAFEGCVVASDAFFPFADGLLEAVQSGARAAIQPGGSVRDDEVIAAADKNQIAMVFTGNRHFRH
jgi:phosphoribosylaminoimidazolecarboxamide formyltransferase/IMP cyclohydrolase